MRQMSYSLVRLGTYEEIKSRLSKNGTPSPFSLIIAASIAGGLGGIAGNPAGEFMATKALYFSE
jgi:solute carrier family 25 (mitochondrial dicarboxylate transporter), member 10